MYVQIVINILEHIPSMPLLLAGRVLGGLSTSLLFSTFEAWMVTEHRRRGFPEPLLASTFAICSWGNGLVAILAGVLAQVASDVSGDIGPFQLAILLTILSLAMILPWRENYGSSSSSSSMNNDDVKKEDVTSVAATLASIGDSCSIILDNRNILFLGLSQAFFEGAIYTFGMIPSHKLKYTVYAICANFYSYNCLTIGSVYVGALSASHFADQSPPHRSGLLGLYAGHDARRHALLPLTARRPRRLRHSLCSRIPHLCSG